MTIDFAQSLYQPGRAHAGAACLLYRAAVDHANDEGIANPVDHVFNGQNSLSIMHLLGLGIELMLKAVIVAGDQDVDERFIKYDIGHNLVKALVEAEKRGFASEDPHLQQIIDVLDEPYSRHWLRYGADAPFGLPGDFDQVVHVLETLDRDVTAFLEISAARMFEPTIAGEGSPSSVNPPISENRHQ